MTEHDPRCEGGDDQKVIDNVEEYGWHVMNVLDTANTPGFAYSIGLYHNFKHPEIIVFGLKPELMHSIINSIGEDVRQGQTFEDGREFSELIADYDCMIKTIDRVWYIPFLGYASWFYKSDDFPVLQCIWPDKKARYP